jgi:hypothetical protein
MEINLCTLSPDNKERPALKIFSIEEFVPENKFQNEFVKKLRLLEEDEAFEERILTARYSLGITQEFIDEIRQGKEPLSLYIKDKSEEQMKFFNMVGTVICEESGLDPFTIYTLIFADAVFVPTLEKPLVVWNEPTGKQFPDLVHGGVSIVITRKMSITEFKEGLEKIWPRVETMMGRIPTNPFPISFIHIRDLEENLKIYKLRKKGLGYKQIAEELKKESIYYEEATLRQKVKAIKDQFVKKSSCKKLHKEKLPTEPF